MLTLFATMTSRRTAWRSTRYLGYLLSVLYSIYFFYFLIFCCFFFCCSLLDYAWSAKMTLRCDLGRCRCFTHVCVPVTTCWHNHKHRVHTGNEKQAKITAWPTTNWVLSWKQARWTACLFEGPHPDTWTRKKAQRRKCKTYQIRWSGNAPNWTRAHLQPQENKDLVEFYSFIYSYSRINSSTLFIERIWSKRVGVAKLSRIPKCIAPPPPRQKH